VVGVRRQRFLVNLASITVAAFVLRLVYVALLAPQIADKHYHLSANLLARGYGFVNAAEYAATSRLVPSATHPPLFPLVLGAVSYLGGTSIFAHQVTCCVLSTAAVVVIGLIGWDLAGARAGLFAAALAGLYPSLWANDGVVFSESLFTLTMALFIWTAYRFWQRPRLLSASVMGVATALAALTRGEAIVLLVGRGCVQQQRSCWRPRW
jgi:4-amino-4-deoxy-L-arabinose transferase-like glycosyltransferase